MNNNNRIISEKIYLFTLFAWVVITSLVTTTYFGRLDGFISLYRPIIYFTIIILLFKELINLPRTLFYFNVYWKQLLIVILLIFSMFIISKNRDGLLNISVLFLVFSARDIDYKKLLCTFSVATFTVLLITVLSSNMGIIPNMLMNVNGGYRYSLGFTYVSFASQRLFFAICSYLMFKDKRITYLEMLFLLLLTIYFYKQTSTSSPFYLSIIVLAYALISLKVVKRDIILKSIFLSNIAKFSYLISLCIVLFFCFYSSGEFFHLIDQFTHNRLRLSVEGFQNFGVHLFGQRISFKTLDIFGNFTSDYNFIDSSFVQLFVIDGLIVAGFMLFAITNVMKYFLSIRKDIVLACLGIMIIHGMFDPQMLVLQYSPLILLISRLFVINSNNRIE